MIARVAAIAVLFTASAAIPAIAAEDASWSEFYDREEAAGRNRDAAKALVESWIAQSDIPGSYTTRAERAAKTEHEGDLTNNHLYFNGPDGVLDHSHGMLHHTKPNPAFQSKKQRKKALDAIAWMLRRGMSRLQDTVLASLATVPRHEVDHLLTLAREALNGFARQ